MSTSSCPGDDREFADRHIGPDAVEQAIMLETLGYRRRSTR